MHHVNGIDVTVSTAVLERRVPSKSVAQLCPDGVIIITVRLVSRTVFSFFRNQETGGCPQYAILKTVPLGMLAFVHCSTYSPLRTWVIGDLSPGVHVVPAPVPAERQVPHAAAGSGLLAFQLPHLFLAHRTNLPRYDGDTHTPYPIYYYRFWHCQGLIISEVVKMWPLCSSCLMVGIVSFLRHSIARSHTYKAVDIAAMEICVKCNTRLECM